MKKSRKILIGILLFVIVISVSYIILYYIRQTENENVYKKAQEAVQKSQSQEIELQRQKESGIAIPIDFELLQAQNPDIYAWIQIAGTNINYPIVQSASDNSYYLNHTIEGKEGYPGSIYTENWNSKEFTDYNTVIYGHDMKDGSMFQNLHNFADLEYMKAHPQVIIYTPQKKLTYEIFAAVIYDDRHILHNFDFAFPQERQRFLDSIYEARNMTNSIREEVLVNADSRILTLSTCVTGQDDKRFLVEAVLQNEES